ncbi:MAG: tetratricopeptide repeat protein [Pseudomonadales bacterium]
MDYKDEDEQVAAVKQWWDENGKFVIGAVVLAIAGNFGWTAYKDNKAATEAVQSDAFQKVIEASQGDDLDALLAAASNVQTSNPGSEYAQLATLFAAKALVEKGELEQAAAQLQGVMNAVTIDQPTGAEARLRLAGLQLAMNQTAEALSLASQSYPAAYQARALEVQGDALLAQGDRAGAKAAYQQAQNSEGGNALPLLTYKLNELADV